MKTFLFIVIVLTASSLFAEDKLGAGENFYDKIAMKVVLAQIDAREKAKDQAPVKVNARFVSEEEIQAAPPPPVEEAVPPAPVAAKPPVEAAKPKLVPNLKGNAVSEALPDAPPPPVEKLAPQKEIIVKADKNLVPNFKGNTLKPQKEVIVKPNPALVPNFKGNTLKPQKEVIVKPNPALVPNFPGNKVPPPGAYEEPSIDVKTPSCCGPVVKYKPNYKGNKTPKPGAFGDEQLPPGTVTYEVPIYFEVEPMDWQVVPPRGWHDGVFYSGPLNYSGPSFCPFPGNNFGTRACPPQRGGCCCGRRCR